MEQHTISSREANQRLSRYLDDAANGKETVITRRGKPIAKLVPIEPQKQSELSAERKQAVDELMTLLGDGLCNTLTPFDREDAHKRD